MVAILMIKPMMPSYKSSYCSYAGCIILATYAMLLLPFSESLFISHINQKGLRGNITFQIVEEANMSVLLIESQLEADQLRLQPIIQDSQNGELLSPDSTQPILFDWSLHVNTLEPKMLASCTNDDMGHQAPSEWQRSLPKNRSLALGVLNRWSVQLDDSLLRDDPMKSLSALIWGKSIRLKLSDVHLNKIGANNDNKQQQSELTEQQQQQQQQQRVKQPGTGREPRPNQRISQAGIGGLSKPQLAFSTPSVAPGTLSKPTFAPRPKPSLSSRVKQTTLSSAPILPKPEALMGDPLDLLLAQDSQIVNETAIISTNSTTVQPSSTSTTTTTTTAAAADATRLAEAAFHKRIVKLFANIVVCGNIIDTRNVKTAEAIFDSQIGGKVTIRGNVDDTTLLMLNLYHIRSKVTTRHDWVIMASDILDNRREDEKCKYLQVILDPNNNVDDTKCRRNETSNCRMGDLSKKHGQIQVAGQGKSTRTTLIDSNLPIAALDGSRSLFLVIYEVATKTSNNGLPSRPAILSCAPIKSVKPREVEALFNMDGVRGSIRVSQRHYTEPALIAYDLFGLEGNTKLQSIHELPLAQRSSSDNYKLCSNLGPTFNPFKVNNADATTTTATAAALTTFDSFAVGNLSAKHGPLSVIDSEYEDHYMGELTDLTIQLYGYHSIVGRSLLLSKNNGDPWVCATLNYVADAKQTINLAVVTFFYPVVGQISFQQVAGEPHAETGVLVEVYNPNGAKDSEGHNWLVHLRPALADFYNWSQRCESAGEVYDPIQASIGLSMDAYNRQCQASLANEPLRCKSGDTTIKSGHKLSLPKSPLSRSRHYYTDLFLPLSGQHSIIGRSVVIYDDSSPQQRGNRLACSNIKLVHPLRASVKSWDSGPSIPSSVRGMALFEQDSASKFTRVKLDIGGFNGNVENYAIHNVWTMDDREFPCSNDSLYDIYDPYDSEHSLKLPPSAHYGSTATVDRVKVGDMSRKHGTLESLQSVQKTYTDFNLPLFAPNSIIGRSVVLRAAVNDFRWVCGNIELEHNSDRAGNSREIVALASFDEPRSKISGYVRFYQLEHKDGSLSDTFIQIDLRLQSYSPPNSDNSNSNNNNNINSPQVELKVSDNHNWAVFVNQVGEDAYIAADDVRCIASGFKWNPYLAQDTLEAYSSTTCTPSEQLGCAMGDLGLRHGYLTLGPNNRRTVSDLNLPLVGNYSVMGRSLVIFDNKRPSVKLACANIFADIHLKSNVVIKRTPSFTVARFVEQMRTLLGASDWLLVPELRATKPVANGECVQMTIHFYGQRAHQMQVELNNLITLGTVVRKSTRAGGGEKVSTHYKLCRAGQQQQLISSARSEHSLAPAMPLLLLLLLLASVALLARTLQMSLIVAN